jgi:hypothetical protein
MTAYPGDNEQKTDLNKYYQNEKIVNQYFIVLQLENKSSFSRNFLKLGYNVSISQFKVKII